VDRVLASRRQRLDLRVDRRLVVQPLRRLARQAAGKIRVDVEDLLEMEAIEDSLTRASVWAEGLNAAGACYGRV
ncbi:MAG: hypothetical protein AAFR16_05430, partial [Pseudomonadota bacterium]